MQSVFWDLLILMTVVWTAAVLLGRIGVPRIIGELMMGVILGPEPSEIIEDRRLLDRRPHEFTECPVRRTGHAVERFLGTGRRS